MFVYALASHKGGVGKTTGAATLGAAFALQGRRVLLVDLDPQSSLTASVGAVPRDATASDVLAGACAADAAIVPSAGNMDIIPATAALAVALAALAARRRTANRLSGALAELSERYDVALIDSPSALGAGMGIALATAHVALVPTPCDYLSLRGLMDTQAICAAIVGPGGTGPELVAYSAMCDQRAAYSHDAVAEARAALGPRMLATAIPRSVRLAQAPAVCKTVYEFAPKSPGAMAFARMASELVEMEASYGTTERHSGGNSLAALRTRDAGRSGVDAGARAGRAS